jgi:signal transduction histidine kinase
MKINPIRLWSQARTQILVWYIVLMIGSTIGSILAIRHTVFLELDARVKASLHKELKEFKRLHAEHSLIEGLSLTENVASLFNKFLSRNVTEDDEFFITILDERFYDASSRALPKLLQPDGQLVKKLEKITRQEFEKNTILGEDIVYLAYPIFVNERFKGVFVAVHITTGEREEVQDMLITVTNIMLWVFMIASLLAWLTAGRILKPLQSLTEAARNISESDLTQRIIIKGNGEVVELANTFNDMMERLEQAFTGQRRFTNDIGHELRTPITIIRGHLELMGDDPQEQHETIALVIDELDRMASLVNDLILLAKSEQPAFLRLESIALDLLMSELYAKAQAIASRQWQLDVVGNGQIDGQVYCDRHRITQAVMNLVHNAAQHTSPNGQINLGAAITNTEVQIWVQDTGEGIALEDQQHIFKRFSRGNHTLRTSDGSGLGLAIVQSIAESHGGTVRLQSNLGTGSTFTIVLPNNCLI